MENKGLGEFEELVLLAVCIMAGDAYGISVKRKSKNTQEDPFYWEPFTLHFIACKTRDFFDLKWVVILRNEVIEENDYLKSRRQE